MQLAVHLIGVINQAINAQSFKAGRAQSRVCTMSW
jgi:hypothetical protein